MKTLFLVCSFLRRNAFSFFIVCMVMTVALALLVSTVAEYRYITAARDALNAAYLEHATFFRLPFDEESCPYLPPALSASPACGELLLLSSGGLTQTENGGFFNLTVMNSAAVSAITLPMESGRYLDPYARAPEAVVSAQYMDILSLGDFLTMPDGTAVTVVGFVRKGMPLPSFSHWGTGANANYLFRAAEDRALVFLPEGALRGMPHPVAAVIPHENAAAEEKLALSELVSSYGSTMPFEEFMSRTEQNISASLREKLPLPLFLLVISTLAMISVAALGIERSMNEQSKYYLLGCSKKRSMGIVTLALSVVFSLPILLNLLLLQINPAFLRFDPDAYLLDGSMFLPLLLYWSACLLLTVALPLVLYGKYSPIDFYRRNVT